MLAKDSQDNGKNLHYHKGTWNWDVEAKRARVKIEKGEDYNLEN